MDLPLIIAILALLAWTLLPQLERFVDADTQLDGRGPSLLNRFARWVNN